MQTAFHPLLHDLLREVARHHAGRTAVEWRNTQVSYAQLETASNHVANCLRSAGAGASQGAVVAVVIDNPVELITSLIGILKAGCAFATLDPTYPDKRLQDMLEAAPPALFLVEQKHAARIRDIAHRAGLSGGHAAPSRFLLVDAADDTGSLPEDVLMLKSYVPTYNLLETPVTLAPDALCYIYFTSGSTGKPKAIAGRLSGLSHFIAWERRAFQVDETYRVSQLIPPAFDPFLRDVFVPLCSGATLCVPDNRETVLNPRQLMQWLEDRKITLAHCVPTLFRALVNEHPDPSYFTSLKYLLIAGEQLFGADVKKWMDIYGERVQLVNLYGPTETTLAKFCYFIRPADKERLLMPVGRPIEGASALILDDELAECPPGVAGEIYIQTPYRTLGYYNRPELTREVFIRNPFSADPDDILYKTGDIGRMLEDGNVEVLGRKDHQVKVRGVRIEPGEIEQVLRDHPLVKDAVVKDWDRADGEKYLCAYFVSAAALTGEELRAFLLGALPPAMIPAVFLRLEKLPLNANGKIDRKALPAPDEASMRQEETFVAPRTPTEERLAAIWADLLGLQRVGVTENFFALGGHSLLAVRVLLRVQEQFQVELPLSALFEAPTIDELAFKLLQYQAEQVDDATLSQLLDELEAAPDTDAHALLTGEQGT